MPIPDTSNIRRMAHGPAPYRIEPAVSESTRISHPSFVQQKKVKAHSKSFKPDLTPIGDVHVADSAKGTAKGTAIYLFFRSILSKPYQAVDNKGINPKGTRQTDLCLAKYSKVVAEEMTTGGACYTGVKWALVNAGVLNDYADMPKGSAKDSKTYFDNHKDKFEKVDVKKEDLSKLPAGMIIVYTKEGTDGHIAITNGNGQEMSDCTDNMKWLESKGKGASYTVYRLTDNWSYDRETMKLKFNPSKK